MDRETFWEIVDAARDRAGAGADDRGAEDDALEQTGVRAVVEEPRPEDDGDVVAPGQLDHREDVLHLVLAVRVERHEVAGTGLLPGVLDPGLQRGSLPEVHGVPEHRGPRRARLLGGRVRAPVVDAHDVPERPAGVAHDVADDARLVVERDHEPDVVVAARVLRSRDDGRVG